MLMNSWLKSFRSLCEVKRPVKRMRRRSDRRRNAPSSSRNPAEVLEQRSLLTTFTPATPADLIADIHTANSNAEVDIIDLGGLTFSLSTVDNGPTSPNGLPQLGADGGNSLTIQNGTVERATGSPRFRIFDVLANADVTFDSVTIEGGNPANLDVGFKKAGGAIRNAGDVLVLNSTLAGNSAHGFGGGLANKGTATVVNSTISGNTTGSSGGGIWNDGGTLNLENSIVAGNFTASRNDVYNLNGTVNSENSLIGDQSGSGVSDGVDGNVTNVDWKTVLDNDGTMPVLTSNGGATQTIGLNVGSPAINGGANALAVDGSGNGLVNDQRGAGFDRTIGGTVDMGAFEYSEAASLVVTTSADVSDPTDDLTSLREALALANSNPDFSEISFGDGGSLTGGTDFTDATSDTITLDGTELQILSDVKVNAPGANALTVSGNDLSRVFKVSSGNVTLAGLTVTEGQTTSTNPLADRTGAGLKIESGATVVIVDSAFTSNSAAGSNGQGSNGLNGGAIWNAGTLEISGSSFSGNAARANGGTIWNSGDLSVVNSTIVGGRARINGGGGGGALFNEGTASFLNATVSGNRAVLGGGFYNVGTLTSSNSVVAGNVGGKDIFGAVTGQNNLVGNSVNAGGLIDGVDGNIVGVDWTTVLENDGLDPTPDDNGGPTSTVALLPGSIALNAGDDAVAALLTTDQRGENRFVGTVDIGAFEVQNQAPTADASGPYTVVEGSDVSMNGAGSSDPDNDTLTYEWDFNYDGTTFDVDATGETPDFTGIDDGDVTVALRVSDGTELSEIVTTTITVANADPAINGLTTDAATLESKSDDGVVNLSGSVTDAGTLDTHEVVVDWGDGNVETIVAAGDLVASPDLAGSQHTYAAGGIYTITVIVIDDDGDSVTETTSAVVQGVGVVDGVLYVIGTNGDDVVKLREKNQGTQLRVKTKFDGGSTNTQYFDIADIDRIEMHLCDGDDYASLTQAHWWHKHSVDISATINGGDGDDVLIGGSQADVIDGGNGDDCLHGESGDDTIHGGDGHDYIDGGWGNDIVYAGAGNDWVWGGFGNDILLGQSGNDRLFGGWGRDIIIAGDGADRLFGQGQDDILITGDTNWDDDEAALKTMRDVWTDSGSAQSRAQAIHDSGLEVFHDDDVDKAWGGWGLDWMLFDSDLDRIYC